jgi:hypothetical protein
LLTLTASHPFAGFALAFTIVLWPLIRFAAKWFFGAFFAAEGIKESGLLKQVPPPPPRQTLRDY